MGCQWALAVLPARQSSGRDPWAMSGVFPLAMVAILGRQSDSLALSGSPLRSHRRVTVAVKVSTRRKRCVMRSAFSLFPRHLSWAGCTSSLLVACELITHGLTVVHMFGPGWCTRGKIYFLLTCILILPRCRCTRVSPRSFAPGWMRNASQCAYILEGLWA
jgi:hypothetical protein